MHTSQIFQAWGKILKGESPSLSIEITKECPLKCPGCYAYDAAHLGGEQTLRDLNDRRGQALKPSPVQAFAESLGLAVGMRAVASFKATGTRLVSAAAHMMPLDMTE